MGAGPLLHAEQTLPLPNGFHLLVDPDYDAAPLQDVGRVRIYNSSATLTATIRGSKAYDRVGSGGVAVIGNDSFVICSPLCDNGSIVDAGAVTFGYTVMSFVSPVSTANSVMGSTANDQVGGGGITKVGTSFYLIGSPLWDNTATSAADAGAIMMAGPTTYRTGVVSASNALVGTRAGDQLGSGGITAVGATCYVISSPLWDNEAATDAGAVTAGHSPVIMTGEVTPQNSLAGTTAGDQISSGGITVAGATLYLIRSPLWDNGAAVDAGAVSPAYVGSARVGAVSPQNSLVGSTANDQVGSGGITIVGDVYLVRSPLWDNGAAADAGAVSPAYFGTAGLGAVSPQNSLVGTTAGDQISSGGITTVGAAAYVICSPLWDNGAVANAGAAHASHVSFLRVGAVTSSNALVGDSTDDQVGSGGVTVVGTTAYLIRSPLWDHSVVADAGAVSYGTTTIGNFGVLSLSNSLVGSHPGDHVGGGGITTAGGTSFTISSPDWCHGAGASTAGIVGMSISGVVSSSNSTVGAESAVPEISVVQPDPVEVAANGSRDFGGVTVGGTQSLTFVIKNTGNDDLRLTGSPRVASSGTDSALFTVAAQPPSLIVTGDSAAFTVRFTPTSEGGKTARLSIAHNDSSEEPYGIDLAGAGLSQVAGWRQAHFGSSASTGAGADDADFDSDGIPNLIEYALGLNPAQSSPGELPQPVSSGGSFGLGFTSPAGISGVDYGAEWSPSLAGGSWLPVPDTGTPPQHIFSVPISGATQIFLRLKVTPAP
ncbi:MAG: choice-of-anchor D domain-containing protein [Prosthecobacter sp.]